VKRIDVLPDDVLLDIFNFYVDVSQSYGGRKAIEAWRSLIRVCQRWRSLVFASPRRLNLHLYCTPDTPARDKLDVWPALPLIVSDGASLFRMDNVIAALGQSNRVRQVDFYLTAQELEKVFAAMQVPFPELTDLRVASNLKRPPVIPDSFLGGSAPRLRSFTLDTIPFPSPGLPNLLSSATHLVNLILSDIPRSGYIPPEEMVPLLSVLSSLRILYLEFNSPPDRVSRNRPPPKRSILPALDEFRFMGVSEYLEELVTFIDAPQLDEMRIRFSMQLDFDCPRLAQFINRTPPLSTRNKARVQFGNWSNSVLLVRSRTLELEMEIAWREPDQQLKSIVQVCNSSLHPLSTVEDLYIERQHREIVWEEYTTAIEITLWLQLLIPYTSAKNLYISKEFAPGIAAALQDLVESTTTEVLPGLQNIFVEEFDSEPSGPFQEDIGQFITARQLSGHPVAISVWNEPV
jgi:hypothetical protein